jgi:phosphate transport system permease protein
MINSAVFNRRDMIFRRGVKLTAYSSVALLFAIFMTIVISSFSSFHQFGFGFIFSKEWDPIGQVYGALPFIVGTILTSFLALLISMPFSLAIAILLGEYSKGGVVSNFIRSMVELLAGVPSVIYGFWGLMFLVPIIRTLEIYLGVLPYGVGILSSSIVLAIMIIPYSSSVAREVISMVPLGLKEAAYSLGSTRFEVVTKVVLPYAFSGIFAGILLSLGRAIGETMAVTMLIGNANEIPKNIFSPANSMASVIANEFAEAGEGVPLAALFEIALILFIISLIINIIGQLVIRRMEGRLSD